MVEWHSLALEKVCQQMFLASEHAVRSILLMLPNRTHPFLNGQWIDPLTYLLEFILRWNQILGVSEFTIIEKKTGKQRTLRLNPQLQEHIQECYEHIQPIGVKAPILVSQKGTIFTIQAINRIFKDIKKKYRVKIKNFSCHSLRKTFGRQVYNMNSDSSELALVKLMELFNHSYIAITKRYLGLRQEEILQTYDCLSF